MALLCRNLFPCSPFDKDKHPSQRDYIIWSLFSSFSLLYVSLIIKSSHSKRPSSCPICNPVYDCTCIDDNTWIYGIPLVRAILFWKKVST